MKINGRCYLKSDTQKNRMWVLTHVGSTILNYFLPFTFFKTLDVFINPNEGNGQGHKWRGN